MKVQYRVYRKNCGDEIPIVSAIELPTYQIAGKKRYVGKKAKIEAVFRLSGTRLSDDYSTKQVNDYLAVNLFKTHLWRKYREILAAVSLEKDVVSIRYEFQYILEVELKDSLDIDYMDERVIYHVTRELIGEPKEMYRGLLNPVVSLKKKYNE